jgi:hypothetical protein
MAEKMAEAPPSPQNKKCRVASSVYKVSNNPKPCAKKEVDASLNYASKGGGGKGISFRPDQPYLHHATKEQLTAVLKKTNDEELDADKEHVRDNGNDEVREDGEYELHSGGVSSGNGEYELHGGGVSSCARSSCRIRQQTNFFADFGNDNHSDSSYEVDSNDGEEDDLDDATGNELDNDGNNEDAQDDDDDATDDNNNDNRDGRLRALKAKLHKEKGRRRRENSPHVYWKSKTIHLGANIPKKQAIEMKESTMVLIKEWRSMQPNPTMEWVILELERLGICKLIGHSASLSDE